MIHLLYKLFHYEPSPNHEDNVKRSLHIIWALISILPVAFVYLLYMDIKENNFYYDLIFYFLILLIIVLNYYFVIVRKLKVFVETDIGKMYYNFGKFNTVGKTIAILAGFGLVIIAGRLMLLLLNTF